MTAERKSRPSAFEEAILLGAPLGRRLDVYTRRIAERAPENAKAYDDLVAQLVAAGAGTGADTPQVGERMPDFVMPDDKGRLVSLGELADGGALVLSLNRGHWCGYCQLELRHLAEIQPEVEGLGARIVSITPDHQPYAKRLKDRHGLHFPVLTDIDNGYALSLGLLIWVGPVVRAIYEAVGRDLSQFQGNDGWFVPVPATFVVGKGGRVLARFVDVDYRRRMPAEDILSALRDADRPA